VAFWAWTSAESGALVVRKPAYLEDWLPAASAGDEAAAAHDDPDVAWLTQRGGESVQAAPPEDVLPDLLDKLCDLGRRARSYVHLVTAFPGDPLADRLEARLYAVKEWGTPRVPAAILQKFVGRLHYVDPDRPILGMRLASLRLQRPEPSS